jgi:hypothetical protein
MKYKIGITASGTYVIDPTLVTDGKPNPVDIREIYPGYDAFGQTLPITFAYLSSAGGPVYLSNAAIVRNLQFMTMKFEIFLK